MSSKNENKDNEEKQFTTITEYTEELKANGPTFYSSLDTLVPFGTGSLVRFFGIKDATFITPIFENAQGGIQKIDPKSDFIKNYQQAIKSGYTVVCNNTINQEFFEFGCTLNDILEGKIGKSSYEFFKKKCSIFHSKAKNPVMPLLNDDTKIVSENYEPMKKRKNSELYSIKFKFTTKRDNDNDNLVPGTVLETNNIIDTYNAALGKPSSEETEVHDVDITNQSGWEKYLPFLGYGSTSKVFMVVKVNGVSFVKSTDKLFCSFSMKIDTLVFQRGQKIRNKLSETLLARFRSSNSSNKKEKVVTPKIPLSTTSKNKVNEKKNIQPVVTPKKVAFQPQKVTKTIEKKKDPIVIETKDDEGQEVGTDEEEQEDEKDDQATDENDVEEEDENEDEEPEDEIDKE